MDKLKIAYAQLDAKVARSTFGRVFHLEGSGHPQEKRGAKFFTEIWAGLTTFFTMAYVIAVNASIVTQTGGTCVCTNTSDPTCATDAAYAACQLVLQRDLITATAAISGVSSIMFGFVTNLPVGLAPGMALNVYFTYNVVGYHGTGPVPYRLALTAVFLEGFIFIFLALIGMRQWLVKLIPNSVKIASGVGIGLFLTVLGLSYSSGIGAVTGGTTTPVVIAGCPPKYLSPTTGQCEGHQMTNPQLWIGVIFGGILTAYLMAYKFKCAIVVGIAVVSIISWPRGTAFTYFDDSAAGESRFEFFKQVMAFHPIQTILGAQDWNLMAAGRQFALAIFMFLYVDILDCTATLYAMARASGAVEPKTGDFPRSTLAYCTDAICISLGSLLGVPPVTAYIESASGIRIGGKTGLTAIVTGTCFLISIFFAPIFASIPPWATGCTLLLVGHSMTGQVKYINWAYVGDSVPAFVTLAVMPLTYSVAYGLIAGLITYTALNLLIYATMKISTFFTKDGRPVEPLNYDSAEYWTYKPRNGQMPWFIRAAANRGRFWSYEETEDEKGEVESVHELTSTVTNTTTIHVNAKPKNSGESSDS